MKRVTKIIIGSVIVVSTVGGIAYAKGGCGMRGPEHMVKDLDLNDEQQKNFQAVIEQFRSARQEMRQNRKQHRDEILSLLNADKLDQTKALGIVEGKTSNMHENAPDMIATVATFTDSLTPKQRQQLREHISDRMDFMHERMSRFGPGSGFRE